MIDNKFLRKLNGQKINLLDTFPNLLQNKYNPINYVNLMKILGSCKGILGVKTYAIEEGDIFK